MAPSRRALLRKHETGQSLVEMAFGMVVLIMLLSGLLDLGRVYFIYIALEDGAGEAALYLSLNPKCNTPLGYVDNPDNPDPECADPNNALWRARNAAGYDVNWAQADIDIPPYVPGVGEPVRVIIRYPFRPITPLISSIAQEITLTVEARQIIVTEAL